MATPINKIFDEAAIEAQVRRIMTYLTEVEAAMVKVQNAASNVKASQSMTGLAAAVEQLATASNNADKATLKLRTAEEQLTVTLQKTAADTMAQGKAMSETEKLAKLYEATLATLNATLSKEAEQHAQSKVALAEVNKQLKEQAREVLGLTGPYQKLQQQFKEAQKKAQDLGATLGVTSNEYKEAASAANEMNNRLKAIDAGVGNFQRNVGNYASGFKDFGLVLRELPNFAISATTGIQSLSNNIPMLADAIALARKEGQSWGTILKGLAGQIFSLGGVITLITIAITGLPKILKSMETELDKMEKKTKTFAEVNALAQKSLVAERVELQALLIVAKDKNKSDLEREAAIAKINKIIPDHIGYITKEAVETGKANAIIEEYIGLLGKMALAQAYQAKIREAFEKRIAITTEPAKEFLGFFDQMLQGAGAFYAKLKKGEDSFYDQLVASKDKQAAYNKKITMAEQDMYIVMLQNMFKADLESGKALIDLDTKTASDREGKARKYYNAIFEMNRSLIENQMAVWKSIRDNDQNGFGARIEAARVYDKLARQLNNELLQNAIAEEKFNTEETLKLKKYTAEEEKTIRNNSAVKIREIEFNFRKDVVKAEIDYLTVLRDLNEKYYQQRQAAAKAAADKEAEDRQASVDKGEANIQSRALRNQTTLNDQLIRLNQKYLSGEIKSYEAYVAEKDKIGLKSAVDGTALEIQAVQEQLKNAKLLPQEREKYENQLSALKLKLTQVSIDADNKETENFKKNQELRRQELLNTLQLIDQSVKNISNAIATLTSIQFEQRQADLETERASIEKNSAAELEKIRTSTLNQQQQADAIIILEARKQAQLEENDRRRRKLEVERARFERLNSIAGIISGTSLAVVNALGAKPWSPFNIALAATVGALGAAQLVKALSSPIPRYKHGTKADGHKGGLAMVGDGGKRETVITPSGQIFDTPSKPTIMDLPKGTHVLPDAEKVHRFLSVSMGRRPEQRRETDQSTALVKWQTEALLRGMKKNKPVVKSKVSVNLGRDIHLYNQVFK